MYGADSSSAQSAGIRIERKSDFSMNIKIINNKVFLKDRMVGTIENGVYVKEVIPKKHYLIQGRGYAIAKEVVDFLSEYGIGQVMIKEKKADGTTMRYTTSVESYKKGNLIYHEPFEMQLVIPLVNLKVI